jgi:hypothetical protein
LAVLIGTSTIPALHRPSQASTFATELRIIRQHLSPGLRPSAAKPAAVRSVLASSWS